MNGIIYPEDEPGDLKDSSKVDLVTAESPGDIVKQPLEETIHKPPEAGSDETDIIRKQNERLSQENAYLKERLDELDHKMGALLQSLPKTHKSKPCRIKPAKGTLKTVTDLAGGEKENGEFMLKNELPVQNLKSPVPSMEDQVPPLESQVLGNEDQVPGNEDQVPGNEDQAQPNEDQQPGSECREQPNENQEPQMEYLEPSKEDQVQPKENQVQPNENQEPPNENQVQPKESQVSANEDQVSANEGQAWMNEYPGKKNKLQVPDDDNRGNEMPVYTKPINNMVEYVIFFRSRGRYMRWSSVNKEEKFIIKPDSETLKTNAIMAPGVQREIFEFSEHIRLMLKEDQTIDSFVVHGARGDYYLRNEFREAEVLVKTVNSSYAVLKVLTGVSLKQYLFLLRVIREKYRKRYPRIIRPVKLTSILLLFWKYGKLTIADIDSSLHYPRSTRDRLLALMRANQWIGVSRDVSARFYYFSILGKEFIEPIIKEK